MLRAGDGVQGDDGRRAGRGAVIRPDVHVRIVSRGAAGARWYYAALCATWLVLVALLWSSPRGDSAGFAGASVSPWTYLLNQSEMIVRYLRLAFWPRGLVLDYGEPLHVTFADVAPYAIAVAALLAGHDHRARSQSSTLGFLGAWFFLTLAPTSSILPISTEVGAERRMYLPLMAHRPAAVVIGSRSRFAGSWVATRRSANRSTLRTSHSRFSPALLSLGTDSTEREYLSGLTLWQTVLDRWPPHARASQPRRGTEARQPSRRGDRASARRGARPARDSQRARPRAAGARQEHRSGRRAPNLRARPSARARTRGRTSEMHSPRSDAMTRRCRPFSARSPSIRTTACRNEISRSSFSSRTISTTRSSHARDAVRLTPNDPAAHNLLGLALIGQQKIDEAIAEFRASLALQPGNNDAAGYLERTLKATSALAPGGVRGLP